MIDSLIEKIKETKNPSVVGLDTAFSFLPQAVQKKCRTTADAGKAVTEFNQKIIDKIYDIVPAVKIQIAYYEMLGVDGMTAFLKTAKYAKRKKMLVIIDAKRNDIGSTAEAYSKAYLSGVEINGKAFRGFEGDFLTVNPYLGFDGIKPFVEDCKKFDKGIFVLIKTSNKSGAELQDLVLSGGETVYQRVGALVSGWGADLVGKYGYSDVGAVVGATQSAEAAKLRRTHKGLFFLVPGYGAQGATAREIAVCFGNDGLGAIVNSSRGIICAFNKPEFEAMKPEDAARESALIMREDIVNALKERGKHL
jgi:orotidine-5'-phosphate decarboxylase